MKAFSLKFAKFIRGITVPPVLVFALILVISLYRNDVFVGTLDVLTVTICLFLIPILAYPLSRMIPSLRSKGREGQRNLAFTLSFVSYLVALIMGFYYHFESYVKLILLTYFLSVLILVIFNRFLQLRASGHACSITGPLVFLIYFFGWKAWIPCGFIAIGVVWSSLKLKRHTLKEMAFGVAICLMSFTIALCADYWNLF